MSFLSGVGVEASSIPFLNFNWGFIGTIFLVILGTIIISLPVIIGVVIHKYNQRQKNIYKNKVPIFIRTHGKLRKVGEDNARELFVPNSNICLFLLKKRKIYLPRPTRSMDINEFWYQISDNGEWVNFDLSSDPDKDTLAQANYDHRDARYAYTNLKEIIKRNYSDKAIVWWKEYSHVISFILIVVITCAGLIFIISRIGHVVDQLGPLTQQLTELASIMKDTSVNMQNINSGVIKAA